MRDPNWLLSATAQSAAAIIAISGGFIVSRIISLRSQRDIHDRQQRALRREITDLQREQTAIEEDLVEATLKQVRYESWRTIVESRGQADVNDLMNDTDVADGLTPDEVRPYLADLLDAAKGAHIAYSKYHEEQGHQTADHVVLSRYTPDGAPSGEAGEMWSDVIFHLFDPVRSGDSRPRPAYDDRIPDVRRQQKRRPELLASLEAVRQEDRELASELELALSGTGLRPVAVSFAYFLGVGVVLPFAMMASEPVPGSLTSRLIVVAGFVSGVVAVGWALALVLHGVSPKRD